MPIDISQISSQFTDDLDRMQEDFIRRMEQALRGNLSAVDLAALDAQIDFFEELNAMGYSTKVEELINNYDQIIIDVHREATARGLKGVVGATASDLEILANNEALFLLDKGKLYTQQFKNAVFRGIIGGESIGEILPSLRTIPLTDAQLTIGVSTGISRFDAVSTAKVFQEAPNQRFRLEGEVDLKTRASCRAVMLNQPKEGLTMAEIRSGAWTKIALENMDKYEHSPSEKKVVQTEGYTFINRGGFNCRHNGKATGLVQL